MLIWYEAAFGFGRRFVSLMLECAGLPQFGGRGLGMLNQYSVERWRDGHSF